MVADILTKFELIYISIIFIMVALGFWLMIKTLK